MKIFAVKDETDTKGKALAYLIYHEQAKQFTVELPENADPWETPLLLASSAKRGEMTIGAHRSRLWVRQRIVPEDRQNLGQILKDNNLSEYDEFELLMLTSGRCAQDDYYLSPMRTDELPREIRARFSKRVEDVIPLANGRLLVFFRNGVVKRFDANGMLEGRPELAPLRFHEEYFNAVAVFAGGDEIGWDEQRTISAAVLYEDGEAMPLSSDDFRRYVQNRVVGSAEAAEMLGCSRQNINDLIRRGKLHPFDAGRKNRLFPKSELEQRMRRN